MSAKPAKSGKSAANWRNRTLFHGDNLGFLRAMNSESVDLIATDPPFNKGRDFHATPDSLVEGAKFQDRWSWEKDVHQEWVDQITDDHPKLLEAIESARNAHSNGMGAFICFMAVRLLEMRRILKPTGSIYLHCDPTASHYLKAVMDAIFGWKNFRNEIVWRIGWVSGFKTQKRGWIRNHEILLYYIKTDAAAKQFNKEYLPYPEGYVRRDGKPPTGKGVPLEDTWNCSDADRLDSIMIMSFAKKTGYPTEKPLALYERMIRASSNEGDIVLDPFCGCATTLVGAERLQRKWVGMDIWQKAHDVVLRRLEIETGLFGKVHYKTDPPKRTDDGGTAAPHLRVKQKVQFDEGPKWSRDEMYEYLIEQHGLHCWGCYRTFDDKRYLELDHNLPRSDGGGNNIKNRILLCSPCNRLKSNKFTLTGLRSENRKRGYMRG